MQTRPHVACLATETKLATKTITRLISHSHGQQLCVRHAKRGREPNDLARCLAFVWLLPITYETPPGCYECFPFVFHFQSSVSQCRQHASQIASIQIIVCILPPTTQSIEPLARPLPAAPTIHHISASHSETKHCLKLHRQPVPY